VPRAALLAIVLATSCTPDASDAVDAGEAGDAGTPEEAGLMCGLTCVDAQSDASLLQKVEGILGAICANPDGCHGGGGNVPFLLSGGADFSPLIDVPSVERPEMVRVKPGDPAHSYLYLKVACEGGIDGSCMPPGPPQPSLGALFYGWIEAGAPTH
jgi:hypothetical protein